MNLSFGNWPIHGDLKKQQPFFGDDGPGGFISAGWPPTTETKHPDLRAPLAQDVFEEGMGV